METGCTHSTQKQKKKKREGGDPHDNFAPAGGNCNRDCDCDFLRRREQKKSPEKSKIGGRRDRFASAEGNCSCRRRGCGVGRREMMSWGLEGRRV